MSNDRQPLGPESFAIQPEQMKAIDERLNGLQCHYCDSSRPLRISPYIHVYPLYHDGGVVMGGPAGTEFPVIITYCADCGAVQPFSAEVFGVLPSSDEADSSLE